MTSQATATPASTPVTNPAVTNPAAIVLASPSPRPTRTPVPMPSLKPGETITWIKLERPIFPLSTIVMNSFAFVSMAIVGAVMIGVLLGHLRSGKGNTHGTGGLGLR